MTLRLLIFMVTVFVANDVISQNQTARPAILWQKCLGGSGDDKANDVLLTTDGGMILAGTSASSDGDVTGNHGGYDGWVVKLNAAGTKQWQRAVGGSSNDGFNTIIKTSDGGYLCVGYTSSNDGDVSGLHNQAGNVYRRDSWVVKLSDSGTVVWSNVYGGSHDDVANSALEISDGNYAIIGTAVSNNGDVHVVDSFEYYKGWVFKISTTGNLIWEKSFGEDEPYATGGGFGYNIIETDNHELLAYISGNRDYDSVVITPSDNWPGEWDTTVYPRIYSSPGILYKLAISNGASSYFDQTKGDGYFSMMKAAHGLYFSYLHYSFKIAPGYVNGYCMDETSEIAYRDNSTGKLEAVRTYLERCEDIGSTLFSRFSPASMHGTYQLADGQILQAGTQSGQSMCGGATGDGTLRFAGINGYYYGGSSDDVFNVVRGFPNGHEIVCAGYTRSVDVDLLGIHGNPELECMGTDADFWVLKLSITPNRISGNLFLDENNNNIKDVNEPAFNKAMVKSAKAGTEIAAGISNGHYEVLADTGTFTTKLHLYNPAFYDASPISTTTVFTVNNTADTINFAVHKLGEFKDCSVSLFAAGSIVRPGFPVAYKIKCVNNGTEALTNRSLIYVKDSHLQFQNATISPQSISGDTLVWNLSQLQPDSIISITVNMLADNIPLINLNDTIYSFVSIDTTADYTPADNSAGLRQRVTGSFDPNDKQESHAGVITKLEVQRGNYLNYSIRFQNTGNDTAFNIIVRDSLDEKLSPGDFEMVECSHPYSFKITKGKYITWELPHTNLVDSFHNEPVSHGYISYRIKPKAGVAVGDHINNSASIYFDFNLPVETNTETTIVRRTVAVWTGKVNTDWANKENWDINEVPDGETTVIIPASVANSPVVNRNAECYSIQVDPLASITINAGYNLLINGK